MGQWHNGYKRGAEPMKILMFVTGEVGRPFAVARPRP